MSSIGPTCTPAPYGRFRSAAGFAFKHLITSLVVAAASASIVFGLWYPHPYSTLSGGTELFLLLVSVDVAIGPLLSFVVYDRRKPRKELVRDLAAVFLLQVAALVYGLHAVTQARPVWLAFEGQHFRVVSMADVQIQDLAEAPAPLRRLSWTGPRPVGVRLLSPEDSNYLQSIELALAGVHPAFRPERWVEYQSQQEIVRGEAKPVSSLRAGERGARLQEAMAATGVAQHVIGYLPLFGRNSENWAVLIDMRDATVLGYLRLE